MAAKSRGIWAIDIGNNALKALHLRRVDDTVEAIGFDNIEHGKVLSGENITSEERSELISASLRQFAERNPIGKEEIIISVPGQSSFARFIKLPPVEPKGIPKIVQYEAVQQIPFDIREVEWDWQLMGKPDSPEAEVAIFAIKNDIAGAILEYFTAENMTVTGVQMSPMALYNYIVYDRSDLGDTDSKAIVVIDMGADNTDLVICTRNTVWQRCIPIGGNSFTKAISDTFKLNFTKAEKLKRTAAVSKYARQIFQAMRPVFSDLAAEVQRSLGFYSSSNRDVKLQKVIALGGGMKLQGLIKFLQQTIQCPIIRPDSFEKLSISPDISSAKFHENVADFGVIYGLGLQGLGLAKMENNLLPRRMARAMAWARKSKIFTVAASVLLLLSLASFARINYINSKYNANENVRKKIKKVISEAERAGNQLEQEQSRDGQYEAMIKKEMELFKYRDILPSFLQTIISCLPNAQNTPDQAELFKAFDAGAIESVLAIDRKDRKQLFVTSISTKFTTDLGSAKLPISVPTLGQGVAIGRGVFASRGGVRSRGFDVDDSEEESGPKAGFVVMLEGYSPYKNIDELTDPAGVRADKSKWGFVTRLMNLNEVSEGTVFELYKKNRIEHFVLETGEVEVASFNMPKGIGVERVQQISQSLSGKYGGVPTSPRAGMLRRPGVRAPVGAVQSVGLASSRHALIDPMTKEVISKKIEVDEKGHAKTDLFGNPVYTINDYWFRIKAKFVWKDAPVIESSEVETTRRSGRRDSSRRPTRGFEQSPDQEEEFGED